MITPNDPLFGALLKTKYSNGVLMRIISVTRDCDCPTYASGLGLSIGDPPAPRTTPHFHFVAVPDSEGHRHEYGDNECRYYNQIIPYGGGRFADIPENKSWRFKYFISRIVGRNCPDGLYQLGFEF